MLRAADKRMRIGERLPDIFGGRAVETYPVDHKPPRMSFRTTPPVSGYVAHFDASDLDTVTRSSGVVSALADKTGSFDATASGSPLITIPMGLFNGLPALYFRGSDNFTSGAGMSDMSASGFVVGCKETSSGTGTLFGCNNDGGGTLRVTATTGVLGFNKEDVAGIASLSSPTVTPLTPFVAGFTLTSSDCTLWLNLSSETDTHSQTLTASRTLVIGRVPTDATNASNWLGWMGEMVLYDTTLSSGDATLVIQYLMTKWGVS